MEHYIIYITIVILRKHDVPLYILQDLVRVNNGPLVRH